jgi:hypothetical protein
MFLQLREETDIEAEIRFGSDHYKRISTFWFLELVVSKNSTSKLHGSPSLLLRNEQQILNRDSVTATAASKTM